MRNRSIPKMILLTIITLGIYLLYWFVSTAREMRKQGAKIPNAILIIIPLVNIWWLWKYSKGVDHTTGSKMSTPITFLLLLAIDFIGVLVVQDSFNNTSTQAVPADSQAAASQPVDPAAPTTVAAGVGVVASESNDPLPEPAAPVADQPSGQTAPKPVETQPQPETAPKTEEPIEAPNTEAANKQEPKPEGNISPEEPQPTAPEQPQTPGGEAGVEQDKNNDQSASSNPGQTPGPSL